MLRSPLKPPSPLEELEWLHSLLSLLNSTRCPDSTACRKSGAAGGSALDWKEKTEKLVCEGGLSPPCVEVQESLPALLRNLCTPQDAST